VPRAIGKPAAGLAKRLHFNHADALLDSVRPIGLVPPSKSVAFAHHYAEFDALLERIN
jgi:hypothetical protein